MSDAVRRRGRAAPGDGPTIPGYESFERIGSGGFSAVYRARQSSLGRDVAIKVLNADVSTERDRRTFERECHALGVLSRHPNIVTVYSEAFTNDGRPCIVMELYGANYRERLETEGPLAIAELMTVGVKVAGALDAAHMSGILHRDLKPHNIFVSDYGEPALGDFGISTVDDERSISGASGLSIAYAAPEVLEEAAATVSSDVYSLGATLFHLGEGRAPFAAPQLRSTVKKILTEPAPAPSRGDFPDALTAVLHRALAKRPQDRFASMDEFAEALRDAQRKLGVERTPRPMRRSEPGAPTHPLTTSTDSITVDRRSLPEQPPRGHDAGSTDAGRLRRAPATEPEWSAKPIDASGLPGRAESDVERTVRRPTDGDEIDIPAAAASIDPAPSSTRRRLAAVVGVGAIVVAGLAVALSTRDDAADTVTTTTAVTVPRAGDDVGDEFFTQLIAPSGVQATVADDGTVLITFDPVDEADRYEAQAIDVPDLRVVGDAATIETGVAATRASCWVVRSISDDLASSDDSVVACVAG